MADQPKSAPRDDNRVPVLIGVSSQNTTISGKVYVKGVTPVPVAVDPVTGALQTESA